MDIHCNSNTVGLSVVYVSDIQSLSDGLSYGQVIDRVIGVMISNTIEIVVSDFIEGLWSLDLVSDIVALPIKIGVPSR